MECYGDSATRVHEKEQRDMGLWPYIGQRRGGERSRGALSLLLHPPRKNIRLWYDDAITAALTEGGTGGGR